MRAARELTRCGIAARVLIQRRLDIESVHALPGFGIAVGNGLEGKSAGNIDQHIDCAEMRRRGIDRLFRLGGVGQVDAAQFDPLGGCRELRRRMIDARDARAARKCGLGDHLAKSAQRAGDDNDFTLQGVLRAIICSACGALIGSIMSACPQTCSRHASRLPLDHRLQDAHCAAGVGRLK